MSQRYPIQPLSEIQRRRDEIKREEDAVSRGFWTGIAVGVPSALLMTATLIGMVRIGAEFVS